MRKCFEKILLFLCNHNMIIQTFIFMVLLILQLVSAFIDIDFNAVVITFLIGISFELFQIAVVIEFNGKEKKSVYNVLKKGRGPDYITKDFKRVSENIYLIGINNNTIITSIYSNSDFVNYCLNKGIHLNIGIMKIHNKEQENSNFEWYMKGHLGKKEYDEEKYIASRDQCVLSLRILHTYECYKKLKEKGLLHVRLIDTPLTTTFYAYDIDADNGIIQCQFYQYGLRTEACPCVLLDKNSETYAGVKKSMKELWDDSEDVTDNLKIFLHESLELMGK